MAQVSARSVVSNLGVLSALLAIQAMFPYAPIIASMRGKGELDRELQQASAHGYYESILDGSGNAPRHSARGDSGRTDVPPPPGWRTFADSGIVEVQPTYLRWKMKPGLKTIWNGTTFRTNGLGYRTPEVVIPKPPGTFRIAVIGSSNTLGHGVSDDEVYVRLLERWLNRAATGSGRTFEVVNLAVSGDSSTQKLLRLKTVVPQLEADWIINDATVIDFSLEELHLRWVVDRQVPIPFDFVRDAVARAELSPSDSPAMFGSKLREVAEPLMDATYAAAGAEARRLAVPMTVILLPRADAKIENPYLAGLIRSLAEQNGLECIDISGAFRELTPEEFRVSPWDKHPSPTGHRVIFEAIREAILAQGGLPGLPLNAQVAH
jgi:lysophospholipase L1-like esterase